MALSRKFCILLLALVVSTQGVVATLAMGICCCSGQDQVGPESAQTATCPKCIEAKSDSRSDGNSNDQLNRVCECSKEPLAIPGIARRVADQDSGIYHPENRPAVFVRSANAYRSIVIEPLFLADTIRLKYCVWII
jgi:hypothetical protein